MTSLSLKFFNAFQASIDNQPLTKFRSANVQGLLVYLVLESGQAHSREALSTLFWPEDLGATARKNLRWTLHQLRKLLGDDQASQSPFLLVNRQTVQLNRASQVQADVHQFQQAFEAADWHRASNLYSGELLPGFPCDSAGFESWLSDKQEQFQRQALDAFYQLAEQKLTDGDFAGVQQTAKRQLTYEPWREVAHRQLMQAFALSGQRGAALAQFEKCREILQDKLGITPNRHTLRLHERILSGELVGEQEAKKQPAKPLELPLDMLPPPAPLPNGSIMPFSRNPLFVGRETDLKALASALNSRQALTISQVETAATTGLGGIGKTQLASEFVHRFGQFFHGGVFWLSFDSSEAIMAEIAACGEGAALGVPAGFSQLPLARQVRLVQAEWQKPIPRLLIFDNCEDPALLAKWRPTSGGCRVIITSRRGDWELALGVQMLALGVLGREESIALLQKHRPDLPLVTLDMIAEELGDLPLALHLAGCYLYRYRRIIDPEEYLTQLRDPLLLYHPSMCGDGISPTAHNQHVGRTFALSYDQLDSSDETDVLALRLLVHTAHFAPGEPIWYRLLVKTLEMPDDIPSALAVELAFGRLIELGLIETEGDVSRPGTDTLRMHRLVAKFVRDVAHDQVVATQQTVEAVVFDETASVNESGYPLPLLAWQLHLRSVVDIAQARGDLESARLCAELAQHLWKIGDYKGALPYAKKALEIQLAVLGEEDLVPAGGYNLIGQIHLANGDVSEAFNNFNQALAIQERKLAGKMDMSLARTHNLLGLWHLSHGEVRQAVNYFGEALTLAENLVGENNALTARYANNIGNALRRLNEYEVALPYLQRALAIGEKLYGTEHPDIAMNLNNIALVLHDLGRLVSARPYYERAIAIRRQTLGEEHAETALMISNLGSLLIDLGEFEIAEQTLQSALAIFDKTYLEPHPYTAFSLNNLGRLHLQQGKLARSHHYFARALAIRQAILTGYHPLKALSYRQMGDVLAQQGLQEEAIAHWRQALEGYRQCVGVEHPLTQSVQARLTEN